MLGAGEAGEVFALLEGGGEGARAAADALAALYVAVREPWLVRALLQYQQRTGSSRALELLARAPDRHARHLLDALLDQLRERRGAALQALAPLVARRPAWLHRLPAHPLLPELLRAARLEQQPLPLLHALLALAALLPAAPALAAALAPDLAEVLLRPAALPAPPPATRAHLALAQRALFRALYATHPCTALDALRAAEPAGAREAWVRAVTALARSVRLHPALVTGSRRQEAEPARWARLEPHDVLAECRRLTPRRDDPPRDPPPPADPLPIDPAAPPPGSGAAASRAAASLRPGAEPWFALGERCGADSAPPTPLPAEPDAGEPPEAAVEATPENTPARETRQQFKFPGESGAVKAIGRPSRGTSPPRSEASPSLDAYGSRLARVAAERRAADSPVPFGSAAPAAGVARPEPQRAGGARAEGNTRAEGGARPEGGEDREVRELTARWAVPDDWEEAAAPSPPRDPRSQPAPLAPRRVAPPPRRPASCPPHEAAGRRAEAATQTVDTWPEPYEFLVADFYRALSDDPRPQDEESGGEGRGERLDEYLAELYRGAPRPPHELSEQLALTHAQLMYERWRREAHAERNRRLLGRCRQARALELSHAALAERLRTALRERDEARAAAAPRAPPPACPRDAPLERALAAERAARLRAEAQLREAEAQRALDADELRRARADALEASRRVQALARAALAAERRAEHVRRLRHELLVLGEREARLRGAAGERPAPAPDAAALRAALARAESSAEALGARAEAAGARAAELEAALATRDAALAELKRAARAQAEEGAARLKATRDKYAALLCVVRAAEERRLERLAAP